MNGFFFYLAATFFCAYELTRSFVGERLHKRHAPLVDMLAASVGEMVGHLEILVHFCVYTP